MARKFYCKALKQRAMKMLRHNCTTKQVGDKLGGISHNTIHSWAVAFDAYSPSWIKNWSEIDPDIGVLTDLAIQDKWDVNVNIIKKRRHALGIKHPRSPTDTWEYRQKRKEMTKFLRGKKHRDNAKLLNWPRSRELAETISCLN